MGNDQADARQILTAGWRVLFMIGSPIGQARAPFLFNSHFASRGAEIVMVPLEVRPEALSGFMDTIRGASNCMGVVATLPHKSALFHLVDQCTERASELGLVNIVRRHGDGTLAGDMMDGLGFWNGLARRGHAAKEASMVLAGTGAAGTAIALEFAARGGRGLCLLSQSDEDFARLSELVAGRGVKTIAGPPRSLDGWDFVVNATPVGMAHCPGTLFPPSLLGTMGRGGVVVDAITKPVRTRLIDDAASLGLETVDGNEMTAGQFSLMREFLGADR